MRPGSARTLPGCMADAPRRYARLSRRLQASVIDWAIFFSLPALMVLATMTTGRAAGPLLWVIGVGGLALEPVLVAWRGATVGHVVLGLRVVCDDTDTPPGLLLATVRYGLKVFTGPIFAPLVALTPRHQALHDMAVGTVVVVADPAHAARQAAYDDAEPAGPSPTVRARVITTVLYSLALLGAVSLIGLVLSEACRNEGRCGPIERRLTAIGGITWVALQYGVLWLGPAGRLPGVR
jgi:uncharacterized RDD family membrane protein YckC